MNLLLSRVGRMLPRAFRRTLRRWYYPWRVRCLSPDVWLPAKAIRALLSKGEVVVDVGANIGYITYWLSQWVGASGEVHSFEPVSETFCCLASTVKKWRLQNVRLYRAAVSDQEGLAQMKIPHWGDGRGENLYEAHLLSKNNACCGQEERVRNHLVLEMVSLVTLDGVFRHRDQPIAFIKVDVEGHEDRVFRGGAQTLQRWKPVLSIEVGKTAAFFIFDWLTGLGYAAWVPEPSGLRKLDGAAPAADILFLQPHHIACLQKRGFAMVG